MCAMHFKSENYISCLKTGMENRCHACKNYYAKYGVVIGLEICSHCKLESQKQPCMLCGNRTFGTKCEECTDKIKLEYVKTYVTLMTKKEKLLKYYEWVNTYELSHEDALRLYKALEI